MMATAPRAKAMAFALFARTAVIRIMLMVVGLPSTTRLAAISVAVQSGKLRSKRPEFLHFVGQHRRPNTLWRLAFRSLFCA